MENESNLSQTVAEDLDFEVGGEMMAGIFIPTVRTRGCTRLCVKEYGAKGDGVTDDTAAFNNAFAALPASGGEVHVPDGVYLINSVTSIKPRSKSMLNMDTNAILKAKSNASERDYVIKIESVSDVEIRGGRIIGDRAISGPFASWPEQPTHEWGHGIAVYKAQRVTIYSVHISDCVGDGISVGSTGTMDVVISGVTAVNNRRQGLSLVNVTNCVVADCNFLDTNGTSPECGIDIEPEKGNAVNNVRIINTVCRGNAKYGINILKRADAGTFSNISVEGGEVSYNKSNGFVTVGGAGVRISGVRITNNSATGLLTNGTSDMNVSGCTFGSNYTRLGIKTRTAFTLTGIKAPTTDRDILLRGTVTNRVIGTNTFI